jgi:hypothetical protein
VAYDSEAHNLPSGSERSLIYLRTPSPSNAYITWFLLDNYSGFDSGPKQERNIDKAVGPFTESV